MGRGSFGHVPSQGSAAEDGAHCSPRLPPAAGAIFRFFSEISASKMLCFKSRQPK